MTVRIPFGFTIIAVFLSLLSHDSARALAFHETGGISADTLVERIVRLYDNGSYIEAELEGRRLLDNGDLTDSAHVQIEKYIAFSLIAQDKPQQAASHFTALLQIDSTFDLDPLLTSPKILTVFRDTRERFLAQRAAVLQSIPSPPAPAQISYRAILFPGWEQLYRGRTKTGIAFLTVGGASLISTIYCDFRRRDLRTSYLNAQTPQSAVERYRLYDNSQKAEIYSGAIFVLTYILSEVEVFHSASQDDVFSAHLLRHNDHTILRVDIPIRIFPF